MADSPFSPSSGRQNAATGKGSKRSWRRAFKAIMKSYKCNLPNYDLPLRFRPWFVLFTSIVMLVLAFLGFTNFSHELPLNDKILHLVCLCIATTVFYFIFDVEEDARRIWLWRHAPLILTATTCFFFGGIISEAVQSLLPYKEFQMGDVAANLIGSAIGLWTAYYLEKYYRHRREIARLYRPVALDASEDYGFSSSEDEDEDGHGTMLLPTHYTRPGNSTNANNSSARNPTKLDRISLGNVWDEREELFGVGDSESDEEGDGRDPRVASRPPRSDSGTMTPFSQQQTTGPKIIVTTS